MERVKKILVTGANGFVGRELCKVLLQRGFSVRAVVRNKNPDLQNFQENLRALNNLQASGADFDLVSVGDINGKTYWEKSLQGIDVVVHLASRVHCLHESGETWSLYQEVNIDGSVQLATQALQAGVSKFIFMSSIKVNGEGKNTPYTEKDHPEPSEHYGKSKWLAEESLKKIFQERSEELIILRPPLVYGPGVKANFMSLIRLVRRRIPMPFAHISNKRSMIFLGNLVDGIIHLINCRKRCSGSYLISDGLDETYSLPQIIKFMGKSLEVRPWVFPIPIGILQLGLKLLGKDHISQKLFGSLSVSNELFCLKLNWHPPFTFEQGLRETVKDFNVH